MKVTDCGCFGDFLKLEPRTSFLKDIALLVPAFSFLIWGKSMHRLFTSGGRALAVAGIAAISLVYSMSNYVWDIPGQDFRPFKVGTDVAAQKQAEMEAQDNVTVLGFTLTNKTDGEMKQMSQAEFLKVYQDYPEDDWEIGQRMSEPTMEATKISDFELSDEEGEDPVEDLLVSSDYTFLIVAYKLKGAAGDWEPDYVAKWKNDIAPVVEAAQANGHKVAAMTKYNDPLNIQDFRNLVGADYPFWTGDDIMLKTIIRSNPGIVLMKDGKIINKWHHKQLPAFEVIAKEDILAKR